MLVATETETQLDVFPPKDKPKLETQDHGCGILFFVFVAGVMALMLTFLLTR